MRVCAVTCTLAPPLASRLSFVSLALLFGPRFMLLLSSEAELMLMGRCDATGAASSTDGFSFAEAAAMPLLQLKQVRRSVERA